MNVSKHYRYNELPVSDSVAPILRGNAHLELFPFVPGISRFGFPRSDALKLRSPGFSDDDGGVRLENEAGAPL